MKKILVINGPNLNMIGKREPELYGKTTLEDVNNMIKARATELGVEVECFQSNHEGQLIDRIQACLGTVDGIIINAGGYGHYSYALLDALLSVSIPTIEVHISNAHRREEFRHKSAIIGACMGQICGLGIEGYLYALDKLSRL